MIEIDQISNTALLVFARDPGAEARVKAFVPKSTRKSSRIAAALLDHTKNAARLSGMPVFVVMEADQVGSSFGERLCGAMETIWDRGFSKLIVIGSDFPGLSARTLGLTDRLLDANSWVIGPAIDGGAYLIGLHQSQYERNAFLRLSWNTKELGQDLINHLAQNNPLGHVLPLGADIDNAADLLDFLHSSPHSLFAKHLLGILQESVEVKLPENQLIKPFFMGVRSLRAPPLFC